MPHFLVPQLMKSYLSNTNENSSREKCQITSLTPFPGTAPSSEATPLLLFCSRVHLSPFDVQFGKQTTSTLLAPEERKVEAERDGQYRRRKSGCRQTGCKSATFTTPPWHLSYSQDTIQHHYADQNRSVDANVDASKLEVLTVSSRAESGTHVNHILSSDDALAVRFDSKRRRRIDTRASAVRQLGRVTVENFANKVVLGQDLKGVCLEVHPVEPVGP